MFDSNHFSLVIGICGFSEWLNPKQTVETGVQGVQGIPRLIPVLTGVCVRVCVHVRTQRGHGGR